MPRNSRHKSSKHSSRDAREYSDSEKDSSLKERKGKEESSSVRVSKESGSGEKRKLDAKENNSNNNKELFGSGNGEYKEEYSSSKRRKERVEEGVNDRWNGGAGGEDDRGEGTKKWKEKSSESKSKRRDESMGLYGESEEVVKKSSGKSEGKHREREREKERERERESSSRKEGREVEREREREREKEKERDRERDRKGKEGRSEKFIDGEDQHSTKQFSEKTELSTHDLLPNLESENQSDRRSRRKRDGSGDGDKHQDDIGDINDRRLSSRDDGRPKDEKHKDNRYRDKYRAEVDRENRYRDDKQRDERAVRDHTGRPDEKHLRDEKDSAEMRQKKSKPQDGDHERKRDRDRDFDLGQDRDRDHGRDRDCSRERDRDGDRDRDRDCGRDHDRDRDREWDWDRNRDRDWDRDRDKDRDHDRDRDNERNLDFDTAHIDDRSARYKDSRGRKRSPDDRDDYNDGKYRGIKALYPNIEKKSLSGGRVESDTDRARSQARQVHLDNNVGSNRQRMSPEANSLGAVDEYRHFKPEELKYRDAVAEQRPKATSSREATGFPGVSESASKYRSAEKPSKMDDSHAGELSLERSSSSKALPMGLVERSPTRLERRNASRTGARRSLDIEESGRRSSTRDMPSAEDRLCQDIPMEKPLMDESTPADSSFYNRTNQGHFGLIPAPPSFRSGVGSPSFLGSLEEDGSRSSAGARYKRSGDPSLGRGQANSWRGAPNWSSPMPNGYIPFQHGPAHGGFQGMLPHFPSPLFGVRPSMEINHSGIPYHIPEAERFSNHLRPLGWQNMMDGSGPSHLHGWDGNNSLFRDEAHMYGGPEWDQNRHVMNGRVWETGRDMWKGQNGDVNMDLPSAPLKEEFPGQTPVDDALPGQTAQRLQNEYNHHGFLAENIVTKNTVASSVKESSKPSPKITHEKISDPPKISGDDNDGHFCCAYLSKLDISTELAGPELYSECMSLLNVEHSVTVDEDTSMLVNLKDGARAVPKSSTSLLTLSLFPVPSDSIFQRAMEIYKKQRVGLTGLPIVNVGILDVISTSKGEQVPINDVGKAEETVLNTDEDMPDVPISNLEQLKVEVPIAATQEKPEKMVSLDCQEVHVHSHALNLELADEALSDDNPEKPTEVSSGNKIDGISSELDNSEAQGDGVSSPDNVLQAATILPTDDDMEETGKTNGNKSLRGTEERQGFDDAINGSLFFSDGSSKASGTLMPELNESESVILSRIHHSPESTH